MFKSPLRIFKTNLQLILGIIIINILGIKFVTLKYKCFFFNIKLVSARIQFISIHLIHFYGFKIRIKKILFHFNLFSFAGTL